MHQTRGPQKLRAATRHLIEQSQRTDAQKASSSSHADGIPKSLPTNSIAPLLYVYHVRMYPVWPIVHVDSLIADLQQHSERDDYETIALATSIAAATMAQLRLGKSATPERSVTADILVAECLEARKRFDYRSRVNLNSVRTAFFLHVYYENQQPGGSESVLYLREAITLAQMMYLHREASYGGLAADEQKLRRRVLWLLFVTERGVCILHKLPVVLKTDTAMPETDSDDEVLPAFLKLLALFRIFEQSRMFDIVEDYHLGLEPPYGSSNTAATKFDEILEDSSSDGFGAMDRVSDVQRADICVTRHWMRILIWKALSHRSTAINSFLSPTFPLMVGRDLVNVVYRLPRVALQAHGLGMQLKLYEIANSLADAVTSTATVSDMARWDHDSRPSNILARLHSILAALTDGEDNTLVNILYSKVARAHFMRPARILPTLGHNIGRVSQRPEAVTKAHAQNDQTQNTCSRYGNNDARTASDWSGLLDTESRPAGDDGRAKRSNAESTTLMHYSLLEEDPGDLWSYAQPSYDPPVDSSIQHLSAESSALTASTTSTDIDLGALGPMITNALSDPHEDYICLDAYLPITNPVADTQFARLNAFS
ncbi:fungal specific transcription factor domain-containing protein [Aspergillus mulundensis]|uniref:Putative Zn(II)2Cys6 transcription factor n=1 Tax=Aspergillus mulundensis TaxID=1810919 RepID=A0A3D8RFL0_9EURO|nr:putative Zn(II)2Cys6 transcription factor [Aspergillus mulundensis]RDW72750.1 putative Zn(II)2Cys6 transcription factor [Aspergillus mulundensis]